MTCRSSAAQHAHLTAAAAGADDDVGAAVGIDVAGGHVDAAGERAAERRDRVQQREVAAVEHAHLPAAGAGSDDRIGQCRRR